MTDRFVIGARGRLDHYYDWFADMDVETRDGHTILRGPVVDQAHLHGLLATIRDLNLELIFAINLKETDFSELGLGAGAGSRDASRKEES